MSAGPYPLWIEDRAPFDAGWTDQLRDELVASSGAWRPAETGNELVHDVNVHRNGWSCPLPDWAVVGLHGYAKTRGRDLADALGVQLPKVFGVELGASAYHHGGYYAPHTDSGAPGPEIVQTNLRLVSFVVYCHGLPVRFTGGRLLFPDFGASYTPRSGAAVWFRSDTVHAVEVVDVRSGSPGDCRIAAHGFLRKLRG